MSSSTPSQFVPLLSVSQSVFHVGAPTTRPWNSGSFCSSVSPISAGSEASSPNSCSSVQADQYKQTIGPSGHWCLCSCDMNHVITSQITSPCNISNDSAYLFDEASNVLRTASAGTEEDAKLSPADVATLITGRRAPPPQKSSVARAGETLCAAEIGPV